MMKGGRKGGEKERKKERTEITNSLITEICYNPGIVLPWWE